MSTPSAPDGRPTRGRRLYAPTVLGLLATGGTAWLTLGRVWARATLSPDGLPADTVEVTGRDAVPLAAALAVVVVTVALAVLATRGRGRQVVGVLAVLLGVAGAWLALHAGTASEDAVAAAAEQSPAYTGEAPDTMELTAWPWLDRSTPLATGVWLPRVRARQNLVFLVLVLGILMLTFIGTAMRGPYWQLFWPWEAWPDIPARI